MPFSEFLLTKYKAGIEFHPNLGFMQGTLYLGMGWPMLKRVFVFIGSALFFLLFTAISVSAQVITGEITGTVTDPSGASVPGATVAATCAATNASRTATTGNSGSYVLSNLPPCSYSLSVSAQGFKTSLSSAEVVVGITIKKDCALQVGTRTEIVMVEAAAPLVDYSPGVTNEVDTKSIVDLP